MRLQPVSAMTVALALSACAAPLDTYYRAGGEVSRLQADLLTCEVNALEDVPVAFAIRQWPVAGYVGSYHCGAGPFCVGGSWGGEIYSVDVNKDLRTRVTNQCMSEKGYAPISIPRCSDAVALNAPAGQTTVLPELTVSSCVIRNEDGTFQIVNAE
ncbi:MAG: hypothetical protein AAGB28_05960 [Pseudomonadota bacterium]